MVDAIRETEGAETYLDDVSHSDVECDLNVMASTSKRFHYLLLNFDQSSIISCNRYHSKLGILTTYP